MLWCQTENKGKLPGEEAGRSGRARRSRHAHPPGLLQPGTGAHGDCCPSVWAGTLSTLLASLPASHHLSQDRRRKSTSSFGSSQPMAKHRDSKKSEIQPRVANGTREEHWEKQNQTKQETNLKVLLTAKLQNHLSEKAAKILLSEWIKGEQKSLKTYKPPTSNNPVSAGKLHEPSGHPQPLRSFPSAPVPGSFLKTEDVIQRETPVRQDNTFCGKALKQAASV